MSLTDIILLSIIVIILGSIIYFNFIKKSYSPCTMCPERKKCAPKGKESIKDYYHRVCEEEKKNKSSCCK